MADLLSANLPFELFWGHPNEVPLAIIFLFFQETTSKTTVVMNQQPHTSPEDTEIIQRWLISLVKHVIKTEGLEEARSFFTYLKSKSDYQDLMPAVVRKVDKIFAAEEKKLKKEVKDNPAQTRTINIMGPNATYTENQDKSL